MWKILTEKTEKSGKAGQREKKLMSTCLNLSAIAKKLFLMERPKIFLIFPNFLRPKIFSHLATQERTSIQRFLQ